MPQVRPTPAAPSKSEPASIEPAATTLIITMVDRHTGLKVRCAPIYLPTYLPTHALSSRLTLAPSYRQLSAVYVPSCLRTYVTAYSFPLFTVFVCVLA
eukprot:554159-Pleurochrysis_carterae.AAC.1